MFDTLVIKNLAIIDEAEIQFKSGLNIVSGETGAGKSILLEGIGLLLGARASTDVIRNGHDEAIVEGFFSIDAYPELKQKMRAIELDPSGDQLIIRRLISRSGRHRIFANGSLITLSQLQDLARGLVELCGQNEHQSLLSAAYQLRLIDSFAQNTKELDLYQTTFRQWSDLQSEKKVLILQAPEAEQRLDFLKFQLYELDSASPALDEEEILHEKKHRHQTQKTQSDSLLSLREILEGDRSAVNQLRIAQQTVNKLRENDTSFEKISDGLSQSLIHLEEASHLISRKIRAMSTEEISIDEVQDRLALLAKLKRKYGGTLATVIATHHRIQHEVLQLENLQVRIEAIDQELKNLEPQLKSTSQSLSSTRHKSAIKISKLVTSELKDLRMNDADFRVDFFETDAWTLTGNEMTDYQLCSNKGGTHKSLGKIASGGELSRILLALRRVVAEKGGIGVYLFDEIDTGMGGQTAFEVGKKLKSVSRHHQVICITHLPQVASFADHHLVVSKTSSDKETLTRITELTPHNRKEELARMLGGPNLTRRSLENAKELLEIAEKLN